MPRDLHKRPLGRTLINLASGSDVMLVSPDGAGLDWQVGASAAVVFRIKIQAGGTWITVAQWTANGAPARVTIPDTQEGPCSLWVDPGVSVNVCAVASPWGRDPWQE